MSDVHELEGIKDMISFSIPDDPKWLLATASLLADMADSDATRGIARAVEPYAELGSVIEPGQIDLPDPSVAFGTAPAEPLAAADTGSSETPAPQKVATLPPVGAGVDVDNRGFPWDSRIHSSNKEKLKSGQWRAKRNIGKQPELLAQVEAELRALMGQQSTVVSNDTPPRTYAPQQDTPPPPEPPKDDAPVMNFTEFVQYTAQCGKTAEQVKEACNAHGVADLALLSARLDLIPQVRVSLGI